MKNKPALSFWQIWNMSFGFLGIQFGWGLQMANMSAIYSYLGARAGDIALLWLAAPVTGVLIQPLIGQASDRTWTRLGRRRPFILGGAILASIALILMPNSASIWMAAGLLWVLDGTINASMQPFRALVADNLPAEQSSRGFAIQSLFIGLGGTIASALPWMMIHWFGIASEGAGKGHIPFAVTLSFYIGAAAFLGAVLWTVFTTKEIPPEEEDLKLLRARKFDWSFGLKDIFRVVGHLPRRMWELGTVQFFTWVGMFCLWVYFSPAIATHIFHAQEGTVQMEASGAWAGFCFALYNAVCFGFSFVLLRLTRKTGPRIMHAVCLGVGGLGLFSIAFMTGQYGLLFSMTCIGIAWASILSMPYAMLTPALPAEKIGVMMGMFNLFIVFPQILASAFLGKAVEYLFGNNPMNAMIIGGVSMALGSAATLLVVRYRNSESEENISQVAAGH
ncbi:MAG TPA: MFS transporter [Bacteroidales bacterium]|nr:MFS transporter [Bacteroidales bacterium]